MGSAKRIAAVTAAFAGMLAAILVAIGGSAGRASAQSNEITDRYLTTVHADLNGSVDTRKAAVGQQVTVTLRQDARLADYTELPRGTLLVGRITQVQAQDEQHIGAVLAINFDHAQLADGKVVLVRCVIEGVAPLKPLDAPDLGMQRSGKGTASTPRGGLGDGGTGAAGGLGDPQLSTGRNTDPTGVPGRSSTPGTGGAGSNSTGSPGNTNISSLPGGGAVAEAPVVHAGESLSTAPRATALPGVMLSTTATANASGTLIAPGRNISLSGGTQITLGVIRR